MKTIDVQQGSEEWLALRKKKIGASDAAAILNVSPWTTPYQLWSQKVLDEQVKETSAMTRGKVLEEQGREYFYHTTGIQVQPVVGISDEHDWMLASFDGVDAKDTCIVEIKWPNAKDHDDAKNGKIPEKYWPQVQHQVFVKGFQYGHYLSMQKKKNGENEGILIEYKRDDEFLEKMIKAEDNFYHRHIVEGIAPEMTERDLKKMEDPEFNEKMQHYHALKMEIKKKQEEEELMKMWLLECCGKMNCEGPYGKITKTLVEGRVDYSKVPELNGIDLNQYRGKPSERWTISSK